MLYDSFLWTEIVDQQQPIHYYLITFNIWCLFVDLENAFDKIPGELIRYTLRKKVFQNTHSKGSG